MALTICGLQGKADIYMINWHSILQYALHHLCSVHQPPCSIQFHTPTYNYCPSMPVSLRLKVCISIDYKPSNRHSRPYLFRPLWINVMSMPIMQSIYELFNTPGLGSIFTQTNTTHQTEAWRSMFFV